MIKAGVVGSTGYMGIVLSGILLRHPGAELSWVTSESFKGKKLSDVYPHLNGITDLVCKGEDIQTLAKNVDVVFMALPNGMAMDIAPKVLKAGAAVIDLSADLRLKDAKIFQQWYKMEHKSPDLLKEAVYGIPELTGSKGKKIVANPGCYATASILGLKPLIENAIVDTGSIIIDAKSGVSGAGKTLSDETHFPNCNEGISAYKVASHRHTPEIEQALGGIKLTFTPHLVPMTRGILAAIYAKSKKDTDEGKLLKLFQDYYKGKKFIRVLEDKLPSTKYVSGTNYCDIAVKYDKRTGNIIILSVIDNLMKGGSGQAVQNMNQMFGLSEDAGLDTVPIYP